MVGTEGYRYRLRLSVFLYFCRNLMFCLSMKENPSENYQIKSEASREGGRIEQ